MQQGSYNFAVFESQGEIDRSFAEPVRLPRVGTGFDQRLNQGGKTFDTGLVQWPTAVGSVHQPYIGTLRNQKCRNRSMAVQNGRLERSDESITRTSQSGKLKRSVAC
jgi:hypothetical protein